MPTVTPSYVNMDVDGKTFNGILKSVANGIEECQYSHYDNQIKEIKVTSDKSFVDKMSESAEITALNGRIVVYWNNELQTIFIYTDKEKIVLPEDVSYMFALMCNLETIDLERFDFSKCEKFSHMFEATSHEANTIKIDFSSIDCSNATDMSFMFSDFGSFCENEFSINFGENFKTHTVQSMEGMFFFTGMMSLKEIQFKTIFSTECAENMNLMFCGTGMNSPYFNTLNLTNGFVVTSEHKDIFLNCGQAALDELKLGEKFLLLEDMYEVNNTLDLFEQTGMVNCNIWWNKQCNDLFYYNNLKSCKCYKIYTIE